MAAAGAVEQFTLVKVAKIASGDFVACMGDVVNFARATSRTCHRKFVAVRLHLC